MSGALQRPWLEATIQRLAVRADLRRVEAGSAAATVAACLDLVVADLRRRLGALPPEALPHARSAPDLITWRSDVFRASGAFRPFDGTLRQRMLASADTCAAIGEHAAARAYRERAAAVGGQEEAAPSCVPAAARRPRRRAAWSGPNMPPGEPRPFVAGEQLGMFG